MSKEVDVDGEPVVYSHEEFTNQKTKLDEFRSNNVKLMKDIQTLSDKFEGVDIDNYKDLISKQEKLNNKKLIDAGKIDELLDEKTKSMREVHNKELSKTNEVNQSLQDQLAKLVIDNAVRDSATKAGVVDTGMDDILLRLQMHRETLSSDMEQVSQCQ